MKNVPDPNNRPERGKTSERGYGTEWQKTRTWYLRNQPNYPFCQLCGQDFANHVHHIDHDTSNNHPSNLQALCPRCHMRLEHEYRKHNRPGLEP